MVNIEDLKHNHIKLNIEKLEEANFEISFKIMYL